jgi:elongator complex protein 3
MIEEEIIKQIIKDRIKTPEKLDTLKRKISKEYKVPNFSNISLLKSYHNLVENKTIKKNLNLENLLRKRKIRSLSGIVAVSVLTKPYPCPGKCIFCPTEKGLPKSYLSGEPAVERAKMANFDPYKQFKIRIESLEIQGHHTDKIELRIIGGTWTAYPRQYKIWFVKRCFDAANEFDKGILHKAQNDDTLEKAQKKNEKAKNRIVGVSIETRPDLINTKEILDLRKLGITMVELGVQTIYDDILEKCKRGHSVKQTIQATRLLKDAGFKVMYQIMPNLPGSSIKRDFECAKTIFNDARFMPDWLKIYPCVVCRSAELYKIWKRGEHKVYSDKNLIELLIKIKQILPYWVRLARMFRDIPSQKIVAGSKFSNLRQIIQAKMKIQGKICHCIRCREVRENYNPREKIFLFREDYIASGNKEIFLSFENKKRSKLFSLLRLRIAPLCHCEEPRPFYQRGGATRQSLAMIRELHTFGQITRIAEKPLCIQHKGLGKKLIKEAERIAKDEFRIAKIAVISGIGAREYYRKLGYRLNRTYMVKKI